MQDRRDYGASRFFCVGQGCGVPRMSFTTLARFVVPFFAKLTE